MSALLALTIALIGLTVAVEIIVAGSKAVRSNRQLLLASSILESEVERLRAVPGDAVPVVDRLPLHPPTLDALPQAQCLLQVTPYQTAPLKRVRVTVTWQPPNGPERTRSLTTLVGMR